MIIGNKINWSDHIKYICNNISKNIGIIKKVKSKLNKKTLVNLYYTFIYPYITYCNIVWGRASTIYLSKINLLQKRIIRIISHVGFRNHTQFLFKTYQIMNIYQLNKYISCVLMYTHNNGMLPNIFNDMFTHHIMLHSYKMRQEITYKIPYCKTNTRQNTLAYVGSKLWNTIVTKNHLDDCTSIYIFKKKVKHHIWGTYEQDYSSQL